MPLVFGVALGCVSLIPVVPYLGILRSRDGHLTRTTRLIVSVRVGALLISAVLFILGGATASRVAFIAAATILIAEEVAFRLLRHHALRTGDF